MHASGRHRSTKRLSLLLAACAVLGTVVMSTPSASAADPPHTLAFGALPQRRGNQTQQQATEQLEAQIGRNLAIVRVFEQWTDPFPDSFHNWLKTGDRTMILSVKPVRSNGTRVTWPSIANAAPGSTVDTEMRSWADRIRDYGAPIYVALHHEPEASSNTSYGTSADYIAAWRRWVAVFREEGATNVKFIWITTSYAHGLGAGDRRQATKWYPGDDWVDAMGIDAYNWSNCRPNQATAWMSLQQLIEPFRKFGALHPDEELWLAEWASYEDPAVAGRKASWIDQARSLFAGPNYSQFAGISYFNSYHTGPEYEKCLWWVDTSTTSLSSFTTMANDPLYSRDLFEPQPDPDPVAPVAGFTPVCTALDCTFTDTSTDADGTIVQHDWSFGEPASATNTSTDVSPTHSYAAAGTYTVTLAVTDDTGLTNVASHDVVVSVPSTSSISFIGQASANANATAHRVTVPAATQPGDGMILAFTANTSATVTAPRGLTGWRELGVQTNGSMSTRMWTRVAAAGSAGLSVSVTTSAISKGNMVLAVYRGTSSIDAVASVASARETVSRTAHTTPAVTVGSDRAWTVWYWAHKDAATTAFVPPAGVTVRANGTQTGSGRVTGLFADSNAAVGVGSIAGKTATAAAASVTATMWTIVLQPA
jgi:PKD repeat protein